MSEEYEYQPRLDSSDGVFVLSPPRSGSSCLTACISFQGFNLGANPARVKNHLNEKGYFENANVLEFNATALRQIDAEIFSTRPLTAGQMHQTLGSVGSLEDLIAEEFCKDGEIKPFVIKDPRILLLEELYFNVLPDVKVICLTRGRDAIIASLERGWGVQSKMANKSAHFDKVVDNFLSMTADIAGRRQAHIVVFEELLKDPSTVLAGVCEFLGYKLGDKGLKEALEFIDTKLVHFGELTDSDV